MVLYLKFIDFYKEVSVSAPEFNQFDLINRMVGENNSDLTYHVTGANGFSGANGGGRWYGGGTDAAIRYNSPRASDNEKKSSKAAIFFNK